MPASEARRSLLVYLALVAIGTALVQLTIYRRGGLIEDHVALVFALMWTPTFASLLTRLIFRQSIRDVSFRFSKLAWIGIGISILFPIAVGLVAYGGAW